MRHVLVKNGDADARTANDHSLHGRGVRLAAQADAGGRFLNKALDRRHEAITRRFSKADNVEALRDLWRESFDKGDISGAYWAVMSHSESDHARIRDVFGEVHMLSHLVGSASRLDIARLAALEVRLSERDDKIAQQEMRLLTAAEERTALKQQIAELEERLRHSEIARQVENQREIPRMAPVDPTERQRMDDLAGQLRLAREEVRARQIKLASAEQELLDLRHESAAFDTVLPAEPETSTGPRTRWIGSTLLYVGGWRHLFDQIRGLANRQGIDLLFHDGGLEDNTTLHPGLISQADAVFFPVDHVSHTAAGLVKRICSDQNKEFIPLRSAGLGSFAMAITR